MRADGRGRRAVFWVGAASGGLATLIALELWPDSTDADVEQYRAVRDFVRESFVRDVADGELLDHALHGMLHGLDDYSRYYDADEAKQLERETVGRYIGIGVIFRRPISEGQVLFTLPSSPAQQAGVRVGDRFLTIDERPVATFSEPELMDRLSDDAAGPLSVRLRGLDATERDVTIEAASLVDPTVRHTRILDEERRVGYIALLSFSRETPEEFDRAFDFLRERGMQALVLDLRRNYGGVLASAWRIARRFVSSGVIVSTEGRGVPAVVRADPAEALYEGFPLIVLVDRASASASEVLAGALQDHRAAVVIGTPTYGKGMVQTIRRFEDWDTVAKITSSYYYSPSRRNFERTAGLGREFGILPDLDTPVAPDQERAIHASLKRYSPPLDAIPDVEAWERSAGTRFIAPHPADPQLDAALALFAGERPGPQPPDRR